MRASGGLRCRLVGLWRSLRHGTAARAVGKMALTTGIGQLAILATLPLLTRLYDPAAFGLHSLVMAFVGTVSVGACLCLELAIVSAKSEEEADRLFSAALTSIPITALCSAALLFGSVQLGLLGFEALPWWSIPVAALMVALNGAYLASRCRVLRMQDYPALIRASLTQNVTRAVAPILLFPLAPFWAGLSGGELLGRLLGVRGLLLRVWGGRPGSTAWLKLGSWVAVVVREYRYTGWLLATALVDASSLLLISPVLAGTYGPHAAGQFFLVNMIMVAPSGLICNAAADVIHVRGATIHHTNPDALPSYLRKVAVALLATGIAIYLPLYVFAPLLLPPLFGANWPLVSDAARALTPFIVASVVASPCSRLLIAVNRPTFKVLSDVLRLIGVPVVIYASYEMGKSFIEALQYLGWFLAVAYAFYFALTYAAVVTTETRSPPSSGNPQ